MKQNWYILSAVKWIDTFKHLYTIILLIWSWVTYFKKMNTFCLLKLIPAYQCLFFTQNGNAERIFHALILRLVLIKRTKSFSQAFYYLFHANDKNTQAGVTEYQKVLKVIFGSCRLCCFCVLFTVLLYLRQDTTFVPS